MNFPATSWGHCISSPSPPPFPIPPLPDIHANNPQRKNSGAFQFNNVD